MPPADGRRSPRHEPSICCRSNPSSQPRSEGKGLPVFAFSISGCSPIPLYLPTCICSTPTRRHQATCSFRPARPSLAALAARAAGGSEWCTWLFSWGPSLAGQETRNMGMSRAPHHPPTAVGSVRWPMGHSRRRGLASPGHTTRSHPRIHPRTSPDRVARLLPLPRVIWEVTAASVIPSGCRGTFSTQVHLLNRLFLLPSQLTEQPDEPKESTLSSRRGAAPSSPTTSDQHLRGLG